MGRWVLVNASNVQLAWSGSRWVAHEDGLPTGEAQVCNFLTEYAAADYARTSNIVVDKIMRVYTV